MKKENILISYKEFLKDGERTTATDKAYMDYVFKYHREQKKTKKATK